MGRAQGMLEEVIRRRVAEHPDATWLTWKDIQVSWREVLSNGLRAANGLLDLGVRPGERVALLMANRPEFLWAHLGIVFLGAHSVPVNISQRGATLQHILADSESVAAILQDDLRDAVLAVRESCPDLRHGVVVDGRPGGGVDWDFERLMSAPDTEPQVELSEPSGGVGMLYTSGTTGPPKGVVATNYDLSPLSMVLETLGVQPGETMYTPLPLFHANALLISAIGSMLLDARLALAERFSASRLWDECRRDDAVEFNTLGGMISILLKQPARPDDADNPVRTVFSAGCPADRWLEFERRFGVRIVEAFGMVDAPGFLLNDEGRVGAMGKAKAGVEYRVVGDDDEPLPPHQVGELVFRHPRGRMTYYHGMPEATDTAYRGGWFHSGDLAEYDEQGFFYYRGRKKESMRRRGENISAWEIETVLNQHSAVQESAACAVPSELGEDEVKVYVIVQPGARLTPEEIVDYCDGRMAHYAVPRYVEFVDSLPKTETQRIQYGILRQRGITPVTWDREQAGHTLRRR